MSAQAHIDALLNSFVSAADLARSAVLATDGHEHACHHGKMLTVHCHGWDSTGGQHGLMRVGIRIEGTYSDIGQIFHAPSALVAKSMLDAARDELEKIGRLAPATVGRPSEMEDGKRTNVYIDAASKAKAARIGGNVSEGIRKALDGFPG